MRLLLNPKIPPTAAARTSASSPTPAPARIITFFICDLQNESTRHHRQTIRGLDKKGFSARPTFRRRAVRFNLVVNDLGKNRHSNPTMGRTGSEASGRGCVSRV